ncbi:Thymidylate kinase [Tulasnella sp. 424]|nr:Thymidylate kinase [Tulasnella sp. 424]KAG8971630.1 Thymidylate kinase [Tulasnella sp. 425]
MSGRGTFIVIEGLDRSGKSTQAGIIHNKLVEQLGEQRVKLIKFPGKMIDSYLKSRSDLDDQAIHLLFSANRWEVASSILSDLQNGITIVCDRYVYSGVAFSASKGLSFDWCVAPDVGLPSPDVVLFLDISPEAAKQRGGYGEERYEKEEMQRRVRENFKLLGEEQKTTKEGSWVEIDAGRGLASVTGDVWTVVEKAMGERVEDVQKLWMHRLSQS